MESLGFLILLITTLLVLIRATTRLEKILEQLSESDERITDALREFFDRNEDAGPAENIRQCRYYLERLCDEVERFPREGETVHEVLIGIRLFLEREGYL